MTGYSKEWYQKNKERISKERKERYRTDPVFRAQSIARVKARRKAKPKVKLYPGGDYLYTYAETARQVGVSVWVLRGWREKDYFPEPYAFDGKLWFTPQQVGWLNRLHKFFVVNGPRGSSDQYQDALKSLVRLTYANW